MAYFFGDGFDLYSAAADAYPSYWDSSGPSQSVSFGTAGRFTGSRGFRATGSDNTNPSLLKNSGANDVVHHIVVAFQQTIALGSATLNYWITLSDGATAQCSIVFRQDGSIVLTSGGCTGTILATYTSAFNSQNTWFAYEFEIVINNTTGSFTVRRNGNTSNDFSATSLNTRVSANNYANRISLGCANAGNNTAQTFDDLLWRSDASSVPWVGDVRCFTRMPASDASVAWSRQGAPTQTPFTSSGLITTNASWSFYTPITSTYTGTVGTVTVPINAGFTGNLKCSVFNDASNNPGTVRSSATTLTNPATGTATFTFPTPFSVTTGTQYWIGFSADGSYTNALNSSVSATAARMSTSTGYSAFPAASPTVSNNNAVICSWVVTMSNNYQCVSDAQQDGANSYVYSSTVSQSDLYGIAAIGSTPSSIVGVTTRGYCQKSDAGTRNVAVQLQSGATNVQSASTALNTTWGWIARNDLTDPATGSAWTATGVNNATIGAVVTS